MYYCSIDVGEDSEERPGVPMSTRACYKLRKKKLSCHIFYTVYFQIGKAVQPPPSYKTASVLFRTTVIVRQGLRNLAI